jgi:hypothetical protein
VEGEGQMSGDHNMNQKGEKRDYNALRRELSLLKDQRVLVIQTVEKIIEGCSNVREDNDIHKDAKQLARLVLQDCRGLLMFIKE